MMAIALALFGWILPSLSMAYDVKVDDIYYNLNQEEMTAEVTYAARGYSGDYSGDVTIPSSIDYQGTTYKVTRIGDRAFNFCSELTSIKLPDGIISIGEMGFGCCFFTTVELPASITKIGPSAFESCPRLVSINLPNGLSEIEESVFQGCRSLSSITIPEGVTKIGKTAFGYCEALGTVELPEGLTTIGNGSFNNCISLTSISIPNSVKEIESSAFNWCTKLASVTMGDEVEAIGDLCFYACWRLTSINVSKNLKKVGYAAFSDCNSLVSITLPETVTQIDERAFADCHSLQSASLPQGLSRIEGNTFLNCSSLVSVDIPDGVTTICREAFSGCSSLASILIPANVETVGDAAFSDCPSLSSISVAEGNVKYDSRDNCNAIVETATGKLVSGCRATVIPDDVSVIGGYAFAGSGIASFVIPDWVTTIDVYAFEGCKNLETLVIGSGVTNIGFDAFVFSSNLKEITTKIENPFLLSGHTFDYDVCQTSTLYVPKGTLEAYQSTWGWQDFRNIVEYEYNSIRLLPQEVPADGSVYYDLHGRRLTDSRRGISIVRQADGSMRKVLR